MKIIKNKKSFLIFALIVMGLFIIFGVSQVLYLQKAHSTFENYYAFRGCTKLLSKNPDFGLCETKSGQTIKIVKYQNRWFLDGDLPCGFLCF
jgi:hypothetical protein